MATRRTPPSGDALRGRTVRELMRRVAELVERVHGVRLAVETRLIGFDEGDR